MKGENMNQESKNQELEELRQKVREIEDRLAEESVREGWLPGKYYATYHLLAGMVLGFFGATASLLFNVVGSLMIGQYPLQLVRVYLTFPLGARALEIESGAVIALGCCLYLGTGAAFGSVFHWILSRFFAGRDPWTKFFTASAMGLVLWIVNFYGFLSWAQPVLFGGQWIVSLVPFWVGALTHLVFAWTIVLLGQFWRFEREEGR